MHIHMWARARVTVTCQPHKATQRAHSSLRKPCSVVMTALRSKRSWALPAERGLRPQGNNACAAAKRLPDPESRRHIM
eukprot:1807397-Alexandrium_andersonii.AAC.1